MPRKVTPRLLQSFFSIFIQKQNKERENNEPRNQVQLRVAKILSYENVGLCMAPSFRSSVRCGEVEGSMEKGAWQRKEQDTPPRGRWVYGEAGGREN